MARAVFISKPTFGFAAGILLVAVVTLLWPREQPRDPDAAANAIMGALMVAAALIEAALFSWGSAWGGVQRIPNPPWAVAAGVVTAVGLVAYGAWMDGLPAPVDLETHKQRGLYGMLGVAYIVVASVFSGVLCAWIVKRAR